MRVFLFLSGGKTTQRERLLGRNIVKGRNGNKKQPHIGVPGCGTSNQHALTQLTISLHFQIGRYGIMVYRKGRVRNCEQEQYVVF